MANFETEEKPTVADFLAFAQKQPFHLKLLTPGVSLEIPFLHNEINRPGLSLVGFFKHFAHSRVQIFGQGEFACLEDLEEKKDYSSVKKFFKYNIPVAIFSHGNKPSQNFLTIAEQGGVPIFVSNLSTAELSEYVYNFFDHSFFYKEIVSGVMMEIFGIGVLITGNKSIGKSECALELIERGHRFIADEIVEVSRRREKVLTGSSSSLISKHMNLRGIGIVNVAHLFGVRSVLKQTQVDLCIDLQHDLEANLAASSSLKLSMGADKNTAKEATNSKKVSTKNEQLEGEKNMAQALDVNKDTLFKTILDCNIPLISLPIGLATNTPVLIETAVMNYSLRITGYNTAVEFSKKILKNIKTHADKKQ